LEPLIVLFTLTLKIGFLSFSLASSSLISPFSSSYWKWIRWGVQLTLLLLSLRKVQSLLRSSSGFLLVAVVYHLKLCSQGLHLNSGFCNVSLGVVGQLLNHVKYSSIEFPLGRTHSFCFLHAPQERLSDLLMLCFQWQCDWNYKPPV
jgi:hypothetical protein